MTGLIDASWWNATSRMPPSRPIWTLMRARLYVISCVGARRSRICPRRSTWRGSLKQTEGLVQI
eukprot:5752689-Pyramimonas_sp.AAC.1